MKTKGKNNTLAQLIKAGQTKEQEVAKIPTQSQPENIQEPGAKELPEEELIHQPAPVQKEKSDAVKEKKSTSELSEKNFDAETKSSYQDFFKSRPKEGIEKMNIPGPIRDKLKALAMAEGSSIQNLGGNIIEHFFQTYAAETKKSLKKLSD